MALRSLIQLRGLLETIPGGSKNIAPTDMQNNTPPSAEIQLVLANGDNTITVPALSKGCVVIFDSTSTTTKILKGAAGDTGISLQKTGWIVLTFVQAGGTFIINSSAADTGKYTTIIFF